MNVALGIISLAVLIGLTSCLTEPVILLKYSKDDLSSIPAVVNRNLVTIYQNDDYSCATTSLDIAISYYENLQNDPIDKNLAWQLSGSNIQTVRTNGNDMHGLEKLANHYGYRSEFVPKISLSVLEYLLYKNILVILNISTEGFNYHAVLATGYNKQKEIIYISDPTGKIKELPYKELVSHWYAKLSDPNGMFFNSGFIIYPKELNVKMK